MNPELEQNSVTAQHQLWVTAGPDRSTPLIPPGEEIRLEALRRYGVTDTPPEPDFDDLALMASRVCGTPIALVSLIDADRQWFKARVGLATTQTPRDIAFCAQAILQPDLFVVPDALADERFSTNPLVTASPYIRFYAGAPLITSDGQALGTLCVIDHVPRTLTPEQAEALQMLSRQVVAQLELRKTIAALASTTAQTTATEQSLRALTEGTAAVTGNDFFCSLVRHLATAFQLRYVFVAECLPNERARTLAFWNNGALSENLEYDLAGTPCLNVVAGRAGFHPHDLQHLFPKDTALVDLRAESYHGVPVLDSTHRIIGHLILMDDHPMREDPFRLAVLETFAARAGAELERVRADEDVHRLNLELGALLDINRAIGRYLNRDELFGALAVCLKTLVPAERFGIELPIAGDKLQGHILTPRAAGQDPTQPTVLPASGTVCNWVLQHRTWFVGSSRAELRERFPVTFDVMSGEGMESLCAMPLVSGERCHGALFFMAAAKGAYEHLRRGLFEQVAGAVAVALDNCLAHEEVRRLRDRLAAENVYLQEEIRTEHNFEDIVGTSVAITRVFRAIEKVAATDSTVLITGETGTGKELIARAVHNRSTRKGRVMVKVNCSAIPSGLIESELFGHEKGAFTGASARKKGRFELADGGTIFLDEVGELPLDTQAKLLRVLQEQEFERVGGTQALKVDVRVIAATNRNLQEAVRLGAFRADLYYRLNIFPVQIPALKERPEDIPLLVDYFLHKFSSRLGKRIDRVSPQALERLVGYEWPGNVRELANIIERAVILCDGPVIQPDQLHIAAVVQENKEEVLTLDEAERTHILRVLKETGWVIGGPKGAAVLLGINRTTLLSRMKKLGIDRKP